MRKFVPLFMLVPVLLGQAQTGPASRPAIPIDLSTPAAALASYLRTQQSLDLAAMQETMEVTEARKQLYVDVVLNFRLWRHYLERQAIRRFGPDAGMKVEGHVRSLDDQLTLDLTRIKDGALELTHGTGGSSDTARIFLQKEPQRPDGLQSDRFDFLDLYYLVKTRVGWKVDFLRTCDCLTPDKEPQLKFEAGIFPIMANAMKDLSQRLRKGDFASAEALKTALDDRWNKAYGDAPATPPASAP